MGRKLIKFLLHTFTKSRTLFARVKIRGGWDRQKLLIQRVFAAFVTVVILYFILILF